MSKKSKSSARTPTASAKRAPLKEKTMERRRTKVLIERVLANQDALSQHRRRHELANLLYMDPPWSYGRDPEEVSGFSADPRKHYPVMSDDELRLFNFGDLATRDAVCAMWVPNSLIPFALELLKRQGFEYKTKLTWHKVFESGANAACATRGAVLPSSEDLIIASRGAGLKINHEAQKLTSVMSVVRGEHSAKPAIFRDMLLNLFPRAPDGGPSRPLEIFARQRVQGWHCFGNEV